MLVSSVHAVLQRDLAAVRRSVEAYPDDASLWREVPGLPNSGGTLALHLAGNLQHFVGTALGGTGYVRDRPAEFSRRGVSRREVAAELDAAAAAIDRGMTAVDDDAAALARDFPQPVVPDRPIAVGDMLVHLAVHLAYHLGQIDYHRRVVTGDRTGIGAVAPAELPLRRELPA